MREPTSHRFLSIYPEIPRLRDGVGYKRGSIFHGNMIKTSDLRLDFIIPGAQKAGTTFLYQILKEIPDFVMPLKKEVHFFDQEERFKKGMSWYRSFFPLDSLEEKDRIVGENTPLYLFSETAPARIHEQYPNVKFVVLLRDPVARAISHYWHEVKYGEELLSFSKAIKKEEQRISKGFHHWRQFSYKARGRYAEQVKRYLRYFPVENFHFIVSENLYAQPEEEIARLGRFLGVSLPSERVPSFIPEKRVNAGKYPRNRYLSWFLNTESAKNLPSVQQRLLQWNSREAPKKNVVSRALKEYLQEHFAGSNAWLRRELGVENKHWEE